MLLYTYGDFMELKMQMLRFVKIYLFGTDFDGVVLPANNEAWICRSMYTNLDICRRINVGSLRKRAPCYSTISGYLAMGSNVIMEVYGNPFGGVWPNSCVSRGNRKQSRNPPLYCLNSHCYHRFYFENHQST